MGYLGPTNLGDLCDGDLTRHHVFDRYFSQPNLVLARQRDTRPACPTKRLVTTGIYAYLSNPMQFVGRLGLDRLRCFFYKISG